MKSHALSKALVCALLFIIIGAFDYLTGYEVSSYPAYLIPIFLAFFNFGRWGGYVACIVASIMWTSIDWLNGHNYVHEVSRYWNAGSRLLVYVLFVYGLGLYVKTVNIHRQRLEQMRSLIPICHGCGKIHWKDGSWRPVDELVHLTGNEIPECPDCAAESKKA